MTDKTETDIYLENLMSGEWEIDGSQLLDVAIELSNELKTLKSAARNVCITAPGDWNITCNARALHDLQKLVPDQ